MLESIPSVGDFMRQFVAIAFILFMLRISVVNFWRAFHPLLWHPHDATVIATTVERWRGRRQWQYHPCITYRYSLDGQHYQSRQFTARAPWRTSVDHAWAVAGAYHVGQHIRVYINPANPVQATIQRVNLKSLSFFGGIMLVFTVIGCYVVYDLIA